MFTLNFAPNKDDPNVTDLVDPLDNPHYRKERVPGTEYRINVYGELSLQCQRREGLEYLGS